MMGEVAENTDESGFGEGHPKLMVPTVSVGRTMCHSFEKVSGADLTGREI
jgi:hypothetical protein